MRQHIRAEKKRRRKSKIKQRKKNTSFSLDVMLSKLFASDEAIQKGSIRKRRWSKRFFTLFITFNIWIDGLIGDIFSSTEYLVDTIETASNHPIIQNTVGWFIDLESHTNTWGDLLFVIAISMLLGSVVFWGVTIVNLRFLLADYRCVKRATGQRQTFPLAALVFNIIVFLLLKSYY